MRYTNRVSNLWMIWPGWIAHPDLSLWSQTLHQLHRESHRSRAAWCVQHLNATLVRDRRECAERCTRLAEDEGAQQLYESGVAADRLVKLGCGVREEASLRLTDAGEDRRDAVLLHIDASGEVDLLRTWIGAEGLDDPKDGIGGGAADLRGEAAI